MTHTTCRLVGLSALALSLTLSVNQPLSAQLGGMGGGGGAFPSVGGNKKEDRYRPTQVYNRESGPAVQAIRVVGNQYVPESQVLQQLVTRPGRPLDSEQLQNDVRKLIRTGRFDDVQTFVNQTNEGVIVTYQLSERPTIREIVFEGNDKLSDKKLLKKSELAIGAPLNPYRTEEARRKIQDFYLESGFSQAVVNLTQEKVSAGNGGRLIFKIVEGPKQRIWKVEFVGNSDHVATDARLRTLVQSKSALPWWFKSKLDLEKLDQDVQLLTDYYRRLGFFQAKVSRELDKSEDGSWSTVRFVIEEGPRYRVTQVNVVGNQVFGTQELLTGLELNPGDYFDRVRMNADLGKLRDTYGAKGFIFADIQPELQFSERPGELELLYGIQEGDPYYVRDMRVQLEGDNPHTRHNTIMNYISISPMDVVDIREIRDSKRRLGASQLLETNPAVAAPPDIRVVPAELDEYGVADRSVWDDSTSR